VHHSKYVLFFAFILSTFGATASPLRAAKSDWDNLTMLKPGQLIRVELNDAKSYEGALQAVNDEGITLRRVAGEQTFARRDILRVSRKAKNHRFRNELIGTAIAAILVTPIIAASRRNDLNLNVLPLLFVPVGTGIGATISTGEWHEVYRAH
jgi:hypothetical protein